MKRSGPTRSAGIPPGRAGRIEHLFVVRIWYEPGREEGVAWRGSTVGSLAAHKYHMLDRQHATSGDIFIGADHLPVRIVVDTQLGPMTFTYSRYNSVPDFNAPI